MRAVILGVFLAATALAAQDLVNPEYVVPKENPFTTAADLKSGERLFLGQCARCHGPKGEGGQGAVLARSKLRRASDDRSLFRVIREGVEGTEMFGAPTFSYREIWQLAAYVRSVGRLPQENLPGDPARGKEVYQGKGNCGQCHVLLGRGSNVGPELTDIGARRNAGYLRASLIDPEAAFPEGFLQVRVVTKDGRRITGVRLSEDTFTIQITDMNGRPYSFLKKDLRDLQKDKGKSPMPSYRETLTAAERDDLVAYLASLRGEP